MNSSRLTFCEFKICGCVQIESHSPADISHIVDLKKISMQLSIRGQSNFLRNGNCRFDKTKSQIQYSAGDWLHNPRQHCLRYACTGSGVRYFYTPESSDITILHFVFICHRKMFTTSYISLITASNLLVILLR